MKNEETAVRLTQMFRDLVLAVGKALDTIPIGDERVWELARTLHSVWRAALRSLRTPDDAASDQAQLGHQAMRELIGLIDAGSPPAEVGQHSARRGQPATKRGKRS